MIGEALRTVLLSNVPLKVLVDTRVYAVRFEQAKTFPAITYNTDSIRPLPCRNPNGKKQGNLEIALLAKSPKQLAELTEAVHDALDNHSEVANDYSLTFGVGVDDFDEEAEDILSDGKPTFYKRIEFPLTAKKLS